jgi:hypothetical protein
MPPKRAAIAVSVDMVAHKIKAKNAGEGDRTAKTALLGDALIRSMSLAMHAPRIR